MRLSELIHGLEGVRLIAPPQVEDPEITLLTADSRAVRMGALFAALPGSKVDGAAFATNAYASGAVAILASATAELPPLPIWTVRAEDPRRTLALVAARIHAPQPEIALAVTGTSGKTSVADFTRQLLLTIGHRAASVGTIGVVKANGSVYGSLTTPDPISLHETLAALAVEGTTHVAFEASSHGLDQRRLDGVRITAAAFTNLGRDHLDYHPTIDAYLAAKMRLFSELLPATGVAVVDLTGARADDVLAAARARGLSTLTTGTPDADLAILEAHRDGFAQRLVVGHGGQRYALRLPLVGTYQAANALVAAGLVIASGEAAERVLPALETLRGVPGRLEIVGEVDGALVVVDYAHKPDALEAALTAVRPFVSGRLICVFGCGGDRDRGKRPIMGEIAARLADVAVVSDDNPRSEDPAAIRAEVLAGAPLAVEIGDRAAAIEAAIAATGPGDVVLIAGKGHETGQIVGGTVLPFSDHEVAKASIARRSPQPAPAALVLPAVRDERSPPAPGAISPAAPAVATASQSGRPSAPLWTWADLIKAAGGAVDGEPVDAITNFSIDSRTVQPGDVFVAITDQRDGHAFVPAAFAAGASAALVRDTYEREPGCGVLIRVDDPLRALERIGKAARERLAAGARVVAVTGSAGKTTTKEMLRAALEAVAPGRVHASIKSYNNQWGVPLTLANMSADTLFAVCEIGMNHAGEITPLTGMVAPHVALITNVLPVHVGNFADGETGVAHAKAEIFAGLRPGGFAVLPADSPHAAILEAAAGRAGAWLRRFGLSPENGGLTPPGDLSAALALWADNDGRATAHIELLDREAVDVALPAPGDHIAMNAAAVVAALHALKIDLGVATGGLATLRAGAGRGAREVLQVRGEGGTASGPLLLIDESYNANPASMAAAMRTADAARSAATGRLVFVVGDMLELGDGSRDYHLGLFEDAARADKIFTCGEQMRHLYEALPAEKRGHWAPTSAELAPAVLAALSAGMVVMVKGSLGSRMGPIVDAIKKRFAASAASG